MQSRLCARCEPLVPCIEELVCAAESLRSAGSTASTSARNPLRFPAGISHKADSYRRVRAAQDAEVGNARAKRGPPDIVRAGLQNASGLVI